ncbi:unnamed protein product [Lampetra planeri]
MWNFHRRLTAHRQEVTTATWATRSDGVKAALVSNLRVGGSQTVPGCCCRRRVKWRGVSAAKTVGTTQPAKHVLFHRPRQVQTAPARVREPQTGDSVPSDLRLPPRSSSVT